RLIAAFESCGVPEAMLMDHGVPWWNMKAVAGWTWLSRWIRRQTLLVKISPQLIGTVTSNVTSSPEAFLFGAPLQLQIPLTATCAVGESPPEVVCLIFPIRPPLHTCRYTI